MRCFLLAFAIGLVALAGCTERNQMTQPQLVEDLDLPPGATNVRLLNSTGSWHTYDLTIDGQKFHLLRHRTFGDTGVHSNVILPQR